MIAVLIEKEIRNFVLTFRFAAALLATFVLVVVSVWILADDYVQRQNTYTRLVSEYSELSTQVRVPSQIRPLVHRPPSLLGIFARGFDAQLGNSASISRWEVPREADEALAVNPLLSAMPQFDLQTIFAIVISIFALLISYDALCGEKENGTLKLMYTNRLSLTSIFIAKFIAGTIVLIFPFLLSFISALLILLFVHGLSFSGVQWIAIGAMVLVGLVYSALFIAIGLLCSAVMKRSSSALVLAMFAWVVLVVLLPPLANGQAALFIPLHPPDVLSALEQETADSLSEQKAEYRRENAPTAGSGWGSSNIGGEVPTMYDAPPDWFNDSMRYIVYYEPLYHQRANQIWQEAAREQARKLEQGNLANLLKYISPSHHLDSAFSDLAGTDYSTYADFMERARRYRTAILDDFRNKGLFSNNVHQFFSRRSLEEINDAEGWERRRQAMIDRLQQGLSGSVVMSINQYEPLPANYIPRFDVLTPQPNFADASIPAAALAFSVLIILAFGIAVFSRYDVR